MCHGACGDADRCGRAAERVCAFGTAARDGASTLVAWRPAVLACSSPLASRVAPTRAYAVGAQWEFTTGEALPGAAWEVTYVVDAAEHQRELPLGRTPRTDYAAGACAAEFACDTIDVAGVPLGYVRCTAFMTPVADTCPCSWLNNIGLLKLVLRDADDAEVHVSSLLTQIVRAELLPCVRRLLWDCWSIGFKLRVGDKAALP